MMHGNTEQAPVHDLFPEVPHGDLYNERREKVFLILAGLFLGSMTMLNILGISRFLDLSFDVFGIEIPMALAVGVLPYPLTFLCTDFISELYGRRRANFVVFVGALINIWLLFVLWLGGILPGFDNAAVDAISGRQPVFFEIRTLTLGATAASMIAYLAAQLCDVHLFHFWKRLTGGRHLWLRNNGSTVVSQFVDSFAVITITHFYARSLPIDDSLAIWPQLWVFIGSSYVFKVVTALVDTVPFYFGTHWLRAYLGLSGDEGAKTSA